MGLSKQWLLLAAIRRLLFYMQGAAVPASPCMHAAMECTPLFPTSSHGSAGDADCHRSAGADTICRTASYLTYHAVAQPLSALTSDMELRLFNSYFVLGLCRCLHLTWSAGYATAKTPCARGVTNWRGPPRPCRGVSLARMVRFTASRCPVAYFVKEPARKCHNSVETRSRPAHYSSGRMKIHFEHNPAVCD